MLAENANVDENHIDTVMFGVAKNLYGRIEVERVGVRGNPIIKTEVKEIPCQTARSYAGIAIQELSKPLFFARGTSEGNVIDCQKILIDIMFYLIIVLR